MYIIALAISPLTCKSSNENHKSMSSRKIEARFLFLFSVYQSNEIHYKNRTREQKEHISRRALEWGY
jgi:hypothetical protein